MRGEKSDWSPNKSGESSGEPRMVDMHLSSGWPVAPDMAAAAAMAGAGNWNACGARLKGDVWLLLLISLFVVAAFKLRL